MNVLWVRIRDAIANSPRIDDARRARDRRAGVTIDRRLNHQNKAEHLRHRDRSGPTSSSSSAASGSRPSANPSRRSSRGSISPSARARSTRSWVPTGRGRRPSPTPSSAILPTSVTGGQGPVEGPRHPRPQPRQAARLGLFLAFQYPTAIPGLSVASFIRSSLNATLQGIDKTGDVDPMIGCGWDLDARLP